MTHSISKISVCAVSGGFWNALRVSTAEICDDRGLACIFASSA